MLQEIKTLLPDVDIPINTMDESRVLVPWEDVDDLVSRSVKGRNLQRLPTVRSFNPLDNQTRAFEHLWLHQTPFRNIVRNAAILIPLVDLRTSTTTSRLLLNFPRRGQFPRIMITSRI